MTLVVAAGVFWRYVLNDSLSWTEEVARYIMIWLACVGSVVAMHRRDLVAIDILPNALTGLLGSALRILIALIALLISGFLIYYGLLLAQNAWGQSAASFKMPMFYVTIAVPVAGVGFALISLEQILGELTGSRQDQSTTNGEFE
ncbi:TRAP transporter small permease [Litoreibacter sp.]|nr:TRAP transporter small permease [Litoreibacter sp.]